MNTTVDLPTIIPLSWDEHYRSGRWLFWFTNLLHTVMQRECNYTEEKQIAARRLLFAKLRFYKPPYPCDFGWEVERYIQCWDTYISAANKAGLDTPALEEFHQYVANGRQSVMTFEEVVQCLNSDKSKQYLLNHDMTEEDIASRIKFLTEEYLKSLQNLRLAVDKVVEYVNINELRLVADPETGEAYPFDLRPLYWEFQDHYAYETALYLILYKDESPFKFLRDDIFDC